MRRRRNQQFVLDALVDFKLRMVFQIFPNSGLGVVTWTPWTIRKHVRRHVFNDRVKYDAITALANQRGIGLQLGQDVCVGMVAIQTNEHARMIGRNTVDSIDDFGIDARPLDHLDTRKHRVTFNGFAVVGSDVDINSQHLATRLTRIKGCALLNGVGHVEQGEHGSAEHQRTAMGDASLNDQIWLDLPDDFLHRDDVLRILDDGAAEPFEMVGVLEAICFFHPRDGQLPKCYISSLSLDFSVAFFFESQVVFGHR